jgi:hypothetical protein
MPSQRGLARGLWLAVTIAVGLSFVGRPLGMRAGVLAAQQAAVRDVAKRHTGMPGHAGIPTPCPQHSGQCCAPCLACCAGCVTPSLPAPAMAAGTGPATAHLVDADPVAASAPRSSSRFRQPPPLGPPTPLVS